MIIFISERLFGFTGGYETKSVFHNGEYVSGMPDGDGGNQQQGGGGRGDDFLPSGHQGKDIGGFGKLQQGDARGGIMSKFK